MFRIPAIRLAEAQLAHGPVWMYLFTWETPVFGGVLKACHALEIPFVFDTLDERGDVHRRRARAPRHRRRDARGVDRVRAARATRTRPACPEWPTYDVKRRATMRFDVKTEVLDDPMGDDRAAWGEFRR